MAQQRVESPKLSKSPGLMPDSARVSLPGHDLGPDDAAVLIDQLNGRPFAVVGHAIPDQHVELVLVVLDGQYHRHCLPDLDDARHLGGPGSLPDLDLHPALEVVAEKVGGDRVEHVDLEGPEGDGLLVEIVPGAAQLPGLVPDLLHVRVVLDDYGVLDVAAGGRRGAVSSHVVVRRGAHAARVEEDLEGSAQVAGAGLQVHAVRVRVEALAEYHPVERTVELDVHAHVGLLALDLQVFDLRGVGRRQGPVLLGPVGGRRWPILGRGPVHRPVLQGQGAAVNQRRFPLCALKIKLKVGFLLTWCS
jgi:hypothetical protein